MNRADESDEIEDAERKTEAPGAPGRAAATAAGLIGSSPMLPLAAVRLNPESMPSRGTRGSRVEASGRSDARTDSAQRPVENLGIRLAAMSAPNRATSSAIDGSGADVAFTTTLSTLP